MTTEAGVFRTATSSDEFGLPKASRLLIQTTDKGTQRQHKIPMCWARWSLFEADGALGEPLRNGKFEIDGDHTRGYYPALVDYLHLSHEVKTLTVVTSQEYVVLQINDWLTVKSRGFTRSNGKPCADREAMVELDHILVERGIRIVARMPEGDERSELKNMKKHPLWSAEKDG